MGNGGPRVFLINFTIQGNLYIWGIQSYFHLKMENFAEISVVKQNLYYNPWEMKILLCDFLNYIFNCVYLLYKAIKQTVCVLCTVKWQKYCNDAFFAQITTGDWGDTRKFPSHAPPLIEAPLYNILLHNEVEIFILNISRHRLLSLCGCRCFVSAEGTAITLVLFSPIT